MAHETQAYRRRSVEKAAGYSQAVLAGDYLFISGSVSWDMCGEPQHIGDFSSQLAAVYADIDATLRDHGLTARHVVKETVFTADMQALVAANAKRLDYYQGMAPPSSTWIEIRRPVKPELLLEVEVVAFVTSPVRS
jgi:2-iminobutanoate/2-iminopropanoate deaminase